MSDLLWWVQTVIPSQHSCFRASLFWGLSPLEVQQVHLQNMRFEFGSHLHGEVAKALGWRT
jgi:hypothetical protein